MCRRVVGACRAAALQRALDSAQRHVPPPSKLTHHLPEPRHADTRPAQRAVCEPPDPFSESGDGDAMRRARTEEGHVPLPVTSSHHVPRNRLSVAERRGDGRVRARFGGATEIQAETQALFRRCSPTMASRVCAVVVHSDPLSERPASNGAPGSSLSTAHAGRRVEHDIVRIDELGEERGQHCERVGDRARLDHVRERAQAGAVRGQRVQCESEPHATGRRAKCGPSPSGNANGDGAAPRNAWQTARFIR